jgi:hypothetical protein
LIASRQRTALPALLPLGDAVRMRWSSVHAECHNERVSNPRDLTLFEYGRQNAGLRVTIQALTFMAAWDHARRAMRRETLTLHEYAEWWRVARTTAFREQGRFRQAFPGEATPDRLLDAMASYWDERTGVKGLGAAPLPA